MSNNTDKLFAELQSSIKALGHEPTQAELDRLINEFNAKIAANENDPRAGGEAQFDEFDYLELAANARSIKEKRNYLNKGLEVAPHNFDLKRELLRTEKLTHVERLKAIDALIEEAAKELESENCFKEFEGSFWGVFETRPYMRLRLEKFTLMYGMGMFSLAVKEAKDMLRLCENDNPGVRFYLLFLYVEREDMQAMERLIRKYYMKGSTSALLAEAVYYYKQCEFEKAAAKLKDLCNVNKDTKVFFRIIKDTDARSVPDEHDIEYYAPDSLNELYITVIDNYPVFRSLNGFFRFAYDSTKAGKKKQ